MKKLFALTLAATLLPVSAYCSSAVTVRILRVGTYGNGNLYIALDQSIDEPGCTNSYIEVAANAPALKAVLATAALAVATNATVEVKTDGCLNGVPSFSGARPAYFVLNRP